MSRRFKKHIFVQLIIQLGSIFLFSCFALADVLADPNAAFASKLKPEWIECQKDEDCSIIIGACGALAPAARKSEGNVTAVLTLGSMNSLCVNETFPKPWPKVVCKELKCAFQK